MNKVFFSNGHFWLADFVLANLSSLFCFRSFSARYGYRAFTFLLSNCSRNLNLALCVFFLRPLFVRCRTLTGKSNRGIDASAGQCKCLVNGLGPRCCFRRTSPGKKGANVCADKSRGHVVQCRTQPHVPSPPFLRCRRYEATSRHEARLFGRQAALQRGWVQFDVRAMVRRWLRRGPSANHGLRVSCPTCRTDPEAVPIANRDQHRVYILLR